MSLAQAGTERGVHDRVAHLLDKTHQRIMNYLDAHRIEGRAQWISFCMLAHFRSPSGVNVVEKKMPSRMDSNVPFGGNDGRRSILIDDSGTLKIRGRR